MAYRLLIVDDALIMRRLIGEVARQAGWEVAGEAGNGQEAIDLYHQLRPDLVTMDLVMPIMGGFEAMRRIREADPAARVVVVTAIDQKQALYDAITHGAIDFIVKPFEPSRIAGVLAKVQAAIDAERQRGADSPSGDPSWTPTGGSAS
ncbi:MAG: response regulator [Isosphaeraceae bacterium]